MAMERDGSYWELISTLTPSESGDTIKDLFKNSFNFLKPILSNLFWVEANCVYLNLVCNMPQTKIAEIHGMSQLGVSKRVRTGVKKIKNIILKPESNISTLRDDFQKMISTDLVETAILYYIFKTFSVVSKIIGNVTEGAVRIRVVSIMNQLNKLSKLENKSEIIKYYENSSIIYKDQIIDELRKDKMDCSVLVDTAKRYITFFNLIYGELYASDFIFKKYDQHRK